MSEHIETRRKLSSISTESIFDSKVNQCMISDQDKQILKLWYHDDLTFAEIGEKLNISERTARRHHAKALKKIKDTLLY